MKYIKRATEIEATRWYKNGDHPDDDCLRPFEDTGVVPTEPREGKVVRYYRRPDISGEIVCKKCGKTMHEHGWIDVPKKGFDVCPGEWVVTGSKGNYYVMDNASFEKVYEPVEEK